MLGRMTADMDPKNAKRLDKKKNRVNRGKERGCKITEE